MRAVRRAATNAVVARSSAAAPSTTPTIARTFELSSLSASAPATDASPGPTGSTVGIDDRRRSAVLNTIATPDLLCRSADISLDDIATSDR
jgi:hypothetical protein